MPGRDRTADAPSRYDPIELPLPGGLTVSLGDAERVRGHRGYVLGSRVAFGSLEYRMPLVPSLRTEVLGVVEFGHTTLSAFVDAWMVWEDRDFRRGVQQVGAGLELKNTLRVLGLQFGYAFGAAQAAAHFGTTDGVQLYYRVQTALPF